MRERRQRTTAQTPKVEQPKGQASRNRSRRVGKLQRRETWRRVEQSRGAAKDGKGRETCSLLDLLICFCAPPANEFCCRPRTSTKSFDPRSYMYPDMDASLRACCEFQDSLSDFATFWVADQTKQSLPCNNRDNDVNFGAKLCGIFEFDEEGRYLGCS